MKDIYHVILVVITTSFISNTIFISIKFKSFKDGLNSFVDVTFAFLLFLIFYVLLKHK
jgi:hypothetical protein